MNDERDHGAAVWSPAEAMSILTYLSAVPYRHGPAGTDRAQRAHPRGVAPRGAAALPRSGRGTHVGRADRRGCRSLAAHVLSALRVQTRTALRGLRRWPALVSDRAGLPPVRRTAHRVGTGRN